MTLLVEIRHRLGLAQAMAAWFGQPAQLRDPPWEEWPQTVTEQEAQLDKHWISGDFRNIVGAWPPVGALYFESNTPMHIPCHRVVDNQFEIETSHMQVRW